MDKRRLAIPPASGRVGDGKGPRTSAPSSRGEIRHSRIRLAAPSRDSHPKRRALQDTGSHARGAAAARPQLAGMGPNMGDAQGGRCSEVCEFRNSDIRRHHRRARCQGVGQTRRSVARAINASFVVRTSTSGLHRSGRHQRYLSAPGRIVSGVTCAFSPSIGPRDRRLCAIARTAR